MRKKCTKKKYNLKNKKRFCTFIIMLTVLLATALLATNSYGSAESCGYETITVLAGDTLWDIAGRYNEDGDIREMINEIKKLNNIKDSVIYAGESLKIPL